MRKRKTHYEQQAIGPSRKIVTAAAALFLGMAWSSSTLGATDSGAKCQTDSEDLKSLDVETSQLAVNLVDLPENDPGMGLVDTIDIGKNESDESVPHLYLAPRVTSMLREVFDENDPVDQDWNLAETNDDSAQTETSLPPVAEGMSEKTTIPALEDDNLTRDTGQTMPRFQRAMYRTDI